MALTYKTNSNTITSLNPVELVYITALLGDTFRKKRFTIDEEMGAITLEPEDRQTDDDEVIIFDYFGDGLTVSKRDSGYYAVSGTIDRIVITSHRADDGNYGYIEGPITYGDLVKISENSSETGIATDLNYTAADTGSIDLEETYEEFDIGGPFEFDGDDHFRLTNSSDTFESGRGNDHVTSRKGNDHIDAESGNDSVYGGSGQDTIRGGSGNDKLRGGDDSDIVYGGSGSDNLHGGRGSDILYGGSGSDTIYGDAGNDRIDGSSGNDHIDGSSGNDTIEGGSGRDTLSGGPGNDVFVFRSTSHSKYGSADTIQHLAGGDRIDLSAIDANTLVGGNQKFLFGSRAIGGISLKDLSNGKTEVRLYTDLDSSPEAAIRIDDGSKEAADYSSSNFLL